MAASALVVSNPEERDQLLELLHQAGVANVLARDGSDDTLALCARVRPDVVIVCADLHSGDARAFILAMRELDRRRSPRVILIGETDGPLRTPLDVTDIQIDHFLSQPLSPRALIYAVRSALTLAAELAAAQGPDEPDDPAGASDRATTSRDPELDALGGMGEQPGETEAQPAAEDSTEFVLSASPAAPAWRERTMILGEGEASEDAPGSGPVFGAEAEWQQSPDSISGILVGPIVVSPVVRELTPLPEPMPFIEEEPSEFEEFDLQIEEDLGAELKAELAEPLAPASGDPAVEVASEPHAPDNTFASELQRKMSAMEERLFAREARGAAVAEAVPVAVPAEAPAVPAVAPAVGAEHGAIRRGHSDAAVLLERMYRERFTGRVFLRRRQVEKAIVFDHGRPIFATSNQPEDRLATLLARAGKISDAQAAESDRRVTATGKRTGEVLVELGFLKRRELQPAVRHQLEEIIYSLFSWDQGHYTVEPGAFATAERIRLSSHPATMVIEGVRRKYHMDVLIALVGPPESILEILEPAQRDTLINVAELSASEREVALGFDGRRSITELAERLRVGRLAVYQLAYALIVFGVARVRRPGEAADGLDSALWSEGVSEVLPDGAGEGDADLHIDRQRILARHALVDDADYFAILGVRRDATGFEIQRAYEAACRDHAPAELAPALRHELQRELADIRDVLDEAYQVLRDDTMRSAYLAHLPD